MARADRAPERVDHRWTVGPYTFEAVSRHGFPQPDYPEVMYRYLINGERVDAELYLSLDRALVSAVGARHLGLRTASGPGVGTAADWFCVMVGIAEHEKDPDDGLSEAVDRLAAESRDGSAPVQCEGSRTGWMTTESAVGGYLAKCRACGASAADLGARPELAGDRYLGWTPEHTREA